MLWARRRAITLRGGPRCTAVRPTQRVPPRTVPVSHSRGTQRASARSHAHTPGGRLMHDIAAQRLPCPPPLACSRVLSSHSEGAPDAPQRCTAAPVPPTYVPRFAGAPDANSVAAQRLPLPPRRACLVFPLSRGRLMHNIAAQRLHCPPPLTYSRASSTGPHILTTSASRFDPMLTPFPRGGVGPNPEDGYREVPSPTSAQYRRFPRR